MLLDINGVNGSFLKFVFIVVVIVFEDVIMVDDVDVEGEIE